MPPRLRWAEKSLQLCAPDEPSLALDFINLALDDEYGLRHLPRKPRRVVDVGANIGLFSLLTKLFFPEAIVHAYEPNPRAAVFAVKNLQTAGVTLFNEALGSEFGSALIQDNSDSLLATTKFDGQINSGIPVIPLSEAVRRIGGEIDLLKLDCEGAEWSIFKDVAAFQHFRLVRMEYHLTCGRTVEDLECTAQDLGFEVDRVLRNQQFGIVWLVRRSN